MYIYTGTYIHEYMYRYVYLYAYRICTYDMCMYSCVHVCHSLTAYPYPCCMDMNMQRGQVHKSIDIGIDMQHGHDHAECTGTCRMT